MFLCFWCLKMSVKECWINNYFITFLIRPKPFKHWYESLSTYLFLKISNSRCLFKLQFNKKTNNFNKHVKRMFKNQMKDVLLMLVGVSLEQTTFFSAGGDRIWPLQRKENVKVSIRYFFLSLTYTVPELCLLEPNLVRSIQRKFSGRKHFAHLHGTSKRTF